MAHSPAAIEHARLLRRQGESFGAISIKTGIPKASVWRYLTDDHDVTAEQAI